MLTKNAILCCVLQRRACLDVLHSLKLDLITFSATKDQADEQIPKIFAELLVL